MIPAYMDAINIQNVLHGNYLHEYILVHVAYNEYYQILYMTVHASDSRDLT